MSEQLSNFDKPNCPPRCYPGCAMCNVAKNCNACWLAYASTRCLSYFGSPEKREMIANEIMAIKVVGDE